MAELAIAQISVAGGDVFGANPLIALGTKRRPRWMRQS